MFGWPLIVLVVLGQLSAAALKLPPGDGRYETQIRVMNSADPAKDAETAIRNGDTRFVGVGSEWGLSVPGAPRRAEPEEVRCIFQFGCVIESQEEVQLRHAAHEYAAAYNKALLHKMPSLATTRPAKPSPQQRVRPVQSRKS
jgi:hypothetical protein